jgi:glycosyltransferase involved in cell wall biosynthesis
MDKKVKVLMVHRIFPVYRQFVYDKLAQKFDFLLLHGDKETEVKIITTPYSKIIKSIQYSKKHNTHLLFNSFSHLFRFKPNAVIHESSVGILTLLPMWLCAKIMGIKFIIYGHGYNRFTGFAPEKSWVDKYRVFLMKISDATIVYTKTDKKRMSKYISPDKLFIAQNTLNTEPAKVVRDNLTSLGKATIKQKIGFTYPFNLIYIGRIVEEKKPEVLLEVLKILNKKMPNLVGIHFVGGGEVEPLHKMIAENGWENQVTFHGWIHDEQKTGELLYASDMMIMPGNVGLAVNHAFMYDCPVVTFLQTEMSPPEIEYIEDYNTGFKIPDFSIEKMAETIQMYLENPTLQSTIKNSIRAKMDNELTPENMAKGFIDAVSFVLNKS